MRQGKEVDCSSGTCAGKSRAATQTLLTVLVLDHVGMSDKGMIALATLIDQGRVEQLTDLNLTESECETDRGVGALAQAIETRGLPMLENLNLSSFNVEKVAVQGISDIAKALLKHCPRLRRIELRGRGKGDVSIHSDLVKGMLPAAGLAEKVWVL